MQYNRTMQVVVAICNQLL